jgi:peptidoglycan biosynthesis protein MviN/MurJ (putative lipid II flippase)
LALGTSLAALINAGAQLTLLRRAIGGIEARRVGATLVKVLVASILMAGAAWGTERGLHQLLAGSSLPIQLARVTAALAVAFGVLGVTATLLHVSEFEESRAMVVGRLRRMWSR